MTSQNLVLLSRQPIDTKVIHAVSVYFNFPVVKTINPSIIRLTNISHVSINGQSRSFLKKICYPNQIDFAIVAACPINHFSLMVFDMDSTFIENECIDEIAKYTGVYDQVAKLTEQTMRGEISNFEESLKQRVALLKGIDVDVLHHIYRKKIKVSEGIEKLIRITKEKKIKTLLVSGGFTFFTEKIAKQFDLDFHYANQLEQHNERLTGSVTGPIIDGIAKAEIVAKTRELLNISADQTIVIGDGANDIPMMKEANISIAYRGKESVQKVAKISFNYVNLNYVAHLFEI